MSSRYVQNIVMAIATVVVVLVTPLSAFAGTGAPVVQEQQAVESSGLLATVGVNLGDTAVEKSTLAGPCSFNWTRQLYFKRPNMRGEDVKELQVRLNRSIDAGLKVDGLFGPRTREAVIDFQRDRGLARDGIVGPKTQAALDQVCTTPPIRKRVP